MTRIYFIELNAFSIYYIKINIDSKG